MERLINFPITMFQDEDGMFIAECPSIPGCVSQGKTEAQAEENLRNAIKECLEVRPERGMPLLDERTGRPPGRVHRVKELKGKTGADGLLHQRGDGMKYDFADLSGKLSWQGDAVATQRRLRDEW